MNDLPRTEPEPSGPQRLGYSVRGLANWILDYAEQVGFRHTNMGINKLVFFAVQAFLQRQNTLLTNAKIEAWEHGPVFRELYQSFKGNGNGYIGDRAKSFSTVTEEFEEAKLYPSPDEEALLKEVLQPLLPCNASELRALSHRTDGAWHHVWWYEGHTNPGMEISPALITQMGTGGIVENA